MCLNHSKSTWLCIYNHSPRERDFENPKNLKLEIKNKIKFYLTKQLRQFDALVLQVKHLESHEVQTPEEFSKYPETQSQ
jgi:hypothetical protein